MSTTTIRANVSISDPNVLYYKGHYFKLQHFHNGTTQPLSPTQVEGLQRLMLKVLREAEGSVRINPNTLNRVVFNVESKKLHLWNEGEDSFTSFASTTADISPQTTHLIAQRILGTSPVADMPASNIGSRSNPQNLAFSTNRAPHEYPIDDATNDKRRAWIVTDFRKGHGNDLSENSLKIYIRHMRDKYDCSKVHIEDTLTGSQDVTDLANHKIIQQSIQSYRANPALNQVFIPVNLPGHFCLIALDRQNNCIIAYDSLGVPSKQIQDVIPHLQRSTGLSKAISSTKAQQQHNSDCGIYVLDFIENMIRGKNPTDLLKRSGSSIDTTSLREKFAREIEAKSPMDFGF